MQNDPQKEAILLQNIETNDNLQTLKKVSEANLLEQSNTKDEVKNNNLALEAIIKQNSELIETIKEKNKIDLTAFSDVKTITLQGKKGEKGDKGEVGDTGEKGEKGEQGIEGKQGIQGVKGLKGSKGDTGLTGLKGDTGDKGEQGMTGDKGHDGKDGSPDTAQEISKKINTLKKSIDWGVLKNIPDMGKVGAGYLRELSDVNIGRTDPTIGQSLVWGGTNWILGTGGGSSLSLETDGTPNGSQTLLNLIGGTNITLTDDGLGGVTIDATASNYISTTYAALLTLANANSLVIGQVYLITDRGDTGIFVIAETTSEIRLQASCGFLNGDYQIVGNYSGVAGFVQALGMWRVGTAYSVGDVVIAVDSTQIGVKHYVCISANTGFNPYLNAAKWTPLTKTTTNGYIEEWDYIEYVFENDYIQCRHDRRGNQGFLDYPSFIAFGGFYNYMLIGIQWGNDLFYGNIFQNSLAYTTMSYGTVSTNTMFNFGFMNVMYQQCTVTGNMFQNSGTFFSNSGLTPPITLSTGTLSNCTFMNNAQVNSGPTQVFDGTITQCLFTNYAALSITSTMSGIVSYSTFSKLQFACNIDVTSTIDYSTFDFSPIDGFAPLPPLDFGTTVNLNNIRVTAGYSNLPATIDITGLSSIDMTGNEYAGIITLSSTNATEAVNKVVNSLSNNPYEFTCIDGLITEFQASNVATAPADEIVLENNSNVKVTGRSTVSDFLTLRKESNGIIRQVTGSII